MYIDIQKHHSRYIAVLIEKRMAVLRNRILKENSENWYDYEGSQIEMKICDLSDEYLRLTQVINEFYKV